MNFSFDDNFKRFDIDAPNKEIYIQFIRTPELPIHFFEKEVYVGSLTFKDFRENEYIFSRALLVKLVYRVNDFEDILDYNEIFCTYKSNSILIMDKNDKLRELYVYGIKRMDFDSAKKINAFRYIYNKTNNG